MQVFKRTMALTLTLVMVFSLIPIGSFAAKPQPAPEVAPGDVTIEGTNGFGNLLSDAITEEQEGAAEAESEYEAGYTVTDLEIVDNVATVTYDSMEDAILIVALYTEDGMQMVTSAKTTVTPEATEATVTFGDDVPEYFLASAYLVDVYDLSPLCAAYDTPMYTREMQELLASTVNDFDPEKVLNLDEDETTNFAVYAETTKVIEYVDGYNTVASANDESATYVIENADEQFTTLIVGDVFVYIYSETEMLIVKVAEISTNDTTVTIIGSQLNLDEVFSYMKIEGSSNNADMTVDDSTAAEGISYVGLVEDGVSPQALEGGGSVTAAHKFKFEITEEGESDYLDASLSIKGSVKVSIDVSLNYYISLSRQFLEFKVSPALSAGLTVEGNVTGKYPIGKFEVCPVVGVYVGFAPEIQLEFNGTMTLSAEFSMVIGFAYSSDKGMANLTTKPKVKFGLSVEGTLFFGVDFVPNAKIIHHNVASFTLKSEVGFVLTAKLTGTDYEVIDTDTSKLHSCASCFSLDVDFKATLNGILKFLNCDWLTVKIDGLKLTFNLGSWHKSSEANEFAKGKCEKYTYRLTVSVVDDNGETISGAIVAVDETSKQTNSKGNVIIYLPAGVYTLEAISGELHKKETLKVADAAKVVLKLGSQSEDNGPFENGNFGGIDAADYGTLLDSGTCGTNVYWEFYSGGVLEIYGSGEMKYSGSRSWINYTDRIKQVNILDGVLNVCNSAFSSCDSLETVILPDSVTTIGEYAFDCCRNLRNITLPEGLTTIKYRTFRECDSLQTINIPGSVKAIEEYAFYGSGLTTVTIPASVSSLGNYAFTECDGLREAIINGTNLALGTAAFKDCDNLLTVEIKQGVVSVGNYAFSGCDSLETVILPDSVTTIGEYAFDCCRNLRNITLPEGLTTIKYRTFRECDSLQTINIPGSVTIIEGYAFAYCGKLTKIMFSGNAPSLGSNVFYGLEASVYYPVGNSTWTSDVMQAYGGTITWVPYSVGVNAELVIYEELAVTIVADQDTVEKSEIQQFDYNDELEEQAKLPDLPAEETEPAAEQTGLGAPSGDFEEDETLNPDAVYGGEYGTEITDTYVLKTASFTGLVPGEQYVLLALKSIDGEDPLSADNLLFIDQAAAGEDGTLVFTYVQREAADISYVVACGASNKNLMDAEITFPEMTADGHLQVVNPTVVYDGKILTEGRDYVIVGIVSFTQGGTYTCYIRGIHNYTGLVECIYTVTGPTEPTEPVCQHTNTEIRDAKAATCTEEGYTGDTYCADCGELIAEGETVEMLEHNMVDGTCTECGHREALLGDVNGDGVVNTTDAKIIMQYDLGVLGEEALTVAVADVNGDGKVNTTDAKLIMQLDLGLITEFPK